MQNHYKKINMGTGQDLYIKAKKMIPGGTMLLSKRPEMFLPDLWPAYFSKAKGCEVWDLDHNRLLDMSIMGIGTNTLGYGDDTVDAAVMDTVKKGNMSTLNAPEEVYLAEKLIALDPWAEMVRFTRTGGEANAVAIRIARAASGKEKVAICGYHGWHDWYLSANHNTKDALSNHHLSGLSTNGVPESLKNTVYPFRYNNYEELLKIADTHDIGTIKMEVMRNFGPEDNFLQKVRDLANERNIVLVFDECTSGFRETYGGIYKKYNVEPDVIIYGKTLGNGYAINAIVGRKSVMEAAQNTFISSTFWTERIGSTAALATLKVMEETRSWEVITATGNKVREIWKSVSDQHKVPINLSGIPALSTFSFRENALKYKTYLTQAMLEKGILASTHFYSSTAHKKQHLERYSNELTDVFHTLSQCEQDRMNIDELLQGSVCHGGFTRLN
jgi:glutamate-1-semialdehyde aminotransferase